MAQSEDRRVRRTRERLRQALTQLLLEKDVRDITVRELTDLADVNRGTFYTHYRDIYDLLEQTENALFGELEALLDAYPRQEVMEHVSALLLDVFRFVGCNRDLCRVFLDRQAVDRFSQRLNELIYRKCLHEWQGLTLPGLTDPRYALVFLVGGTVELVRSWAVGGFAEPPEEMAALAERLILSGVRP